MAFLWSVLSTVNFDFKPQSRTDGICMRLLIIAVIVINNENKNPQSNVLIEIVPLGSDLLKEH